MCMGMRTCVRGVEFFGQGRSLDSLLASPFSLGPGGVGQLVYGCSRRVLVSGALGVSGGARWPLDVSEFRVGRGGGGVLACQGRATLCALGALLPSPSVASLVAPLRPRRRLSPGPGNPAA